jgi:hypothetical protein
VLHAPVTAARDQLRAGLLDQTGKFLALRRRELHDPLLPLATVTIAVTYALAILGLPFSVISLIVLLVLPSTKMRERHAASDGTRVAGPDFDDDLGPTERWCDEAGGASRTDMSSTIGTV